MDFFNKIQNFKKYDYDTIKFKDELGSGANSTVYKCLIDNNVFAIKEYDTNKWDDLEVFQEDFIYELDVANRTKGCKRVMKTYGISQKENYVYLIMEYLSKNDLYDYLQRETEWSPCYKIGKVISPKPKNNYIIYNEEQDIYWNYTMSNEIKIKLSKILLESVKEIHERLIVHGDIKTNNIGYSNLGRASQGGTLKLIDLGSSTFMENKNIVKINCKYGTEGYMAPEQYSYCIGYKSDIYSVGVVLVEIWCGDIWENAEGYKPCRNEVLKCIRKMEKSNDKNILEYTKLIRKCLNSDMDKRPTSRNLLKKFNEIYSK